MKTGTAVTLTRLTTEQRLAIYGVAVSAALAAGASQTYASTVTLDLTGLPVASRTTFFGPGGDLYFDVNAATAATAISRTNFAGADFRLFNANTVSASPARVGLIQGAGTGLASLNQIAVHSIFDDRVLRVQPSYNFGENREFDSKSNARVGGEVDRGMGYMQEGEFLPGETGYIALSFRIDPGQQRHWGWANLTFNADNTMTLNGLGYGSGEEEDVHVEEFRTANGVPEGGHSLVLLAMGAGGLLAFRARQSKTA